MNIGVHILMTWAFFQMQMKWVYVNLCAQRGREAADLRVSEHLPVPSGSLDTSRSSKRLCSQLLWTYERDPENVILPLGPY